MVLAVLGLYALLPDDRAVGDAGHARSGRVHDRARDDLSRAIPCSASSRTSVSAPALTDVLRVYVGILAAVILVIATNAGMIGVSRLTFSMGQHRQLPERLRQVHPRYRTPHVAIIAFSVIASIALIPGQADLLATMYSFGAMLSFTIAHVGDRSGCEAPYADRERPWKPPARSRSRGVALPMTAVLGGLGTFAAWVVVMVMNPETMAIGRRLDAARGRRLRRSTAATRTCRSTETVKVVLPEPLDVEEVEFRSVLVPFEDDPFSELTIATAARLAARKRRGIHVISLLNVPAHLPIDAPLPRQEEKAQAKIEQAKLIGGRRVTGHVQRIRPGQAPKAIIEEARDDQGERDRHAARRYRNGTPLYGKTLQGVLGNRPCRVLVAADPSGRRRRGDRRRSPPEPDPASRIAADVVPGADRFERYESAVVGDPRSRLRDHRQDRGRRWWPALRRRPDRGDLRRDRRRPPLPRGAHRALSRRW